MKKGTGYRVQGTVLILFTFYFLLFTFPVHAQSPIPIGEKFGFGDIKTLGEATSKLVPPAFAITAALVILYFLFGAFRYLKAGGDKEEMAGARQMISHAIIGFLILMFAFLVFQFLLSRLFGTTGPVIIQTP
ncbi:hypothetical protein HYU96_04465 [Candidatus Daviesbacteria bacterium]|nr:hypothetical protein [Candidatus Daviesbacteria bacterium]